jgi:gas vesicle protein
MRLRDGRNLDPMPAADAVRLVAFGVGLLAASLIPETEVEKQAAQQLRDNAGDLVDKVREPLADSAQQLKGDLSGSVREAVDQVKETAEGAAQTTADEAKMSARDAADQVRA